MNVWYRNLSYLGSERSCSTRLLHCTRSEKRKLHHGKRCVTFSRLQLFSFFPPFYDLARPIQSLYRIKAIKNAKTYGRRKLIDVELTGSEENYVNETSEDALNGTHFSNQRPSWVQTKTRNWIPGMFLAMRPIERNCSDRRERWLKRMRREDGLREGLKWEWLKMLKNSSLYSHCSKEIRGALDSFDLQWSTPRI